jgi:hypothetical protein
LPDGRKQPLYGFIDEALICRVNQDRRAHARGKPSRRSTVSVSCRVSAACQMVRNGRCSLSQSTIGTPSRRLFMRSGYHQDQQRSSIACASFVCCILLFYGPLRH